MAIDPRTWSYSPQIKPDHLPFPRCSMVAMGLTLSHKFKSNKKQNTVVSVANIIKF